MTQSLPAFEPERVTSSQRIYDGRVLNLRVDTVVMPDGGTSRREIVEHRGATAMVPLLDSETVILVRQFRSPAGAELLEIPAGTLDPHETVETCAHRELREEIFYRAGRMVPLFKMYVAPGYSTEVIHMFLATDLSPEQGERDEDEFLDIVKIPLAEALAKITTGEIIDAKSISGLQYVDRMRTELGLP